MRDIRYKQILARQLEMNRQTWEVLKQKGITDRNQMRLDFSFYAPSRDAADAMETFIREETDYDVQVESTGSILGRQWRVEGTTQEPLSL